MFSPRLRPLKGHERSYGSCKMNGIFFVQSSTYESKYDNLFEGWMHNGSKYY